MDRLDFCVDEVLICENWTHGQELNSGLDIKVECIETASDVAQEKALQEMLDCEARLFIALAEVFAQGGKLSSAKP